MRIAWRSKDNFYWLGTDVVMKSQFMFPCFAVVFTVANSKKRSSQSSLHQCKWHKTNTTIRPEINGGARRIFVCNIKVCFDEVRVYFWFAGCVLVSQRFTRMETDMQNTISVNKKPKQLQLSTSWSPSKSEFTTPCASLFTARSSKNNVQKHFREMCTTKKPNIRPKSVRVATHGQDKKSPCSSSDLQHCIKNSHCKSFWFSPSMVQP